MSDATSKSPFSRLDTSLMRSTKQNETQTERESIGLPANRPTGLPANNQLGRKAYRPIATRKGISLYVDQWQMLKNYSLRQQLKGKDIGISELVRDAIDAYFRDKKED